MSAIDTIFTPIVAQSSDEASLTITARFALCVVVEVEVLVSAGLPEPPDPPQAVSSAAEMQSDSTRDELDIITVSMLTIRCRCRDLLDRVVDEQPNGRSVGTLTTLSGGRLIFAAKRRLLSATARGEKLS